MLDQYGVRWGIAGGTLFVAKSATAYDPGAGAIDYGTAIGQYVTDLVGWGTASAYESTAADAGDLTATTSLARAAGGVDTDDNSADLSASDLSPDAKARLGEMLDFVTVMSRWHDEMLHVPKPALMRLIKLGAGVTKLINWRPGKSKNAG